MEAKENGTNLLDICDTSCILTRCFWWQWLRTIDTTICCLWWTVMLSIRNCWYTCNIADHVKCCNSFKNRIPHLSGIHYHATFEHQYFTLPSHMQPSQSQSKTDIGLDISMTSRLNDHHLLTLSHPITFDTSVFISYNKSKSYLKILTL